MQVYRVLRRSAAAAGLLVLVWSCGERTPVDSKDDVLLARTKPTTYDKMAFRSGELTTYSQSSETKILDDEGGRLGVSFPVRPRADGVSLASARLTVPAGALGAGGNVFVLSMRATGGSRLEDIEILFGPSGTAFSPEARLEIVLYGEVSAEDIKGANHIYGDGQVESVSAEATDRGKRTVIQISVPGFSRYDLDDNDYADTDDPYNNW